VTFGGFVGMTSYISTLLVSLYQVPRLEAGVMMSLLALTGAMVRPLGGLIADRISGVRALVTLLAAISACDLAFALWMPPFAAGIALLALTYVCFGLGNGARFQLVGLRWQGRTGLMSGIIGATGGIGGFYLPVIMGMARESTGSYQMGFATFGVIAAAAFGLVVLHRARWLEWALHQEAAVVPAVVQGVEASAGN
jgi:MFS transporter, NNP family, nitrate/nitrite transporter